MDFDITALMVIVTPLNADTTLYTADTTILTADMTQITVVIGDDDVAVRHAPFFAAVGQLGRLGA